MISYSLYEFRNVQRDMGVGVVGGAPHTCAYACACMHTHTHTCMRGKHDNFMQMATPLGESLGIPYDVI